MGALDFLSVAVAVALVGFPSVFTKIPLLLAGGKSECHIPEKSVLLPVRKGGEIEHVSLAELLDTKCRSLRKPFKPIWWLSK